MPIKSSLVLLNFQRTWSKYTKDPTGNWIKGVDQTISGNVLLRISDNLTQWFDIPLYTGALPQPAAPVLANVKLTTVTRYATLAAGGTGGGTRQYTRREHQRSSSPRKGRKKTKPIRVPVGEGLKTVGGSERRVTLPFPVWFSNAMIMQACGTLFANSKADRKPLQFYTASGSRYLIPYNVTAGAPPTGWKDGAWLSATLVPGANIADPNDPFYSSVIEVSGTSGG
jgi:hypothetical protein